MVITKGIPVEEVGVYVPETLDQPLERPATRAADAAVKELPSTATVRVQEAPVESSVVMDQSRET